MLDLLITNALIVDGTGSQPYHGSVGVRGGAIAELGECTERASRVMDVEGLVVKKKANVCGLADGLAFIRVDLGEDRHGHRRRPSGLIGHSVDPDARGGPDRTDHGGFGVGEDRGARIGNEAISLLCGDRRSPQQQGSQHGG